MYLDHIFRLRLSLSLSPNGNVGLRPWPFGVTWRHRSRGHWTRNMWFPMSGQL